MGLQKYIGRIRENEFDFMTKSNTRICFTDISQLFDKTLDMGTFKIHFHGARYVYALTQNPFCLCEIRALAKKLTNQ